MMATGEKARVTGAPHSGHDGSAYQLAAALGRDSRDPVERIDEGVWHVDHDALGAHQSQHSSQGSGPGQAKSAHENETKQPIKCIQTRISADRGLKTIPEAGLGKKYVDFWGITWPARATSTTSETAGGRNRKAAWPAPVSRRSSSVATSRE